METVSTEDLSIRVIELIQQAKASATPEFYRMNEFNHGLASGLHKAVEIMTGAQCPLEAPSRYYEASASDANLGHEALRLLRGFMAGNGSDVGAFREKAGKLLQVWDINSKGQAIAANIEAQPQKETVWVRDHVTGREYECNSNGSILALPTAMEACADSDGFEFVCLVLSDNIVKAHLVSHDKSVPMDRPICELLGPAPNWLKLRRL